MRSPFPGMDPYLESPNIWPDFHDQMAGQISRDLNRLLPRPYYARLVMRPEIGILGEEPVGRIVPDVTVVRPSLPAAEAAAGSIVLDRRFLASPSLCERTSRKFLWTCSIRLIKSMTAGRITVAP